MAFGVDDAISAGGVALPILTGLIGQALAAGDQATADRLRKQAAEMYGPAALAQLDAVQNQSLGPAAMAGVQADPEMIAYQRQALRSLQEQASTPGLTAAERADFEQGQNEAAQYEQSQRGAIMDSANARGIGGSGFELAQKLAAEQGGAMRSSQAAQQASAAAARRQALANMQLGQMSGDMRGQGFGEASARANAQDAVSRFNTQNANEFGKWKYGAQADLRDDRYGATQDEAAGYDRKAQSTRDAFSGGGAVAAEGLDRYGQNRKKRGL